MKSDLNLLISGDYVGNKLCLKFTNFTSYGEVVIDKIGCDYQKLSLRNIWLARL